MPKEYRIVALHIAICCLFFGIGIFIANHAHAQVPGLPYQLYGKVTNQNGLPLSGASVEAEIGGLVVAKSVTNAQGNYGFAPNLLIISNPEGNFVGKTVTLSINGVPVNQTAMFDPGALKELNLITAENLAPLPVISRDSYTNPAASSSTHEEPVSELSSTTREVTYTTPVFHLKKHKPAAIYEKEQQNKLKYKHSKLLGEISLTLIIIILSWVYLQNYLHARRQKF